ncbi:hypothetical protein QBC38DRAFT_448093 [Podospora fimiseda]|uniref:F-box domain-containing protein n=1 Tax=Podospora fimiseda TaxID=252190 RepID=A0AAN7BFS7_9PEZI|nr:hypothetical protein QBC38DRAFT_448093 [Podospora fimiseda]
MATRYLQTRLGRSESDQLTIISPATTESAVATCPAGIYSLPDELLLQILEYCQSHDTTLRPVLLTCREFNRVGTPLIYKTVLVGARMFCRRDAFVDTAADKLVNLEKLKVNELHLFTWVDETKVYLPPEIQTWCNGARGTFPDPYLEGGITLADLCGILNKAKNLREVYLHRVARTPPGKRLNEIVTLKLFLPSHVPYFLGFIAGLEKLTLILAKEWFQYSHTSLRDMLPALRLHKSSLRFLTLHLVDLGV